MQNGFGATWQASNFGSAPLDVRITGSTGTLYTARYTLATGSPGGHTLQAQHALFCTDML